MAGSAKTKSEDEWRAILNKEQVDDDCAPSQSLAIAHMRLSSVFSVRRVPNPPAPANTTNTKRTAPTAAPDAARRCTRAQLSSTADVAGPLSLMV